GTLPRRVRKNRRCRRVRKNRRCRRVRKNRHCRRVRKNRHCRSPEPGGKGRVNVTQILAGQSSTITVTAYADGVPSSEGTPTCKIIDIDGRIVDEPAASPIPGQPGRWTIKVGPFSHVAQYRARLEFSSEFTVD